MLFQVNISKPTNSEEEEDSDTSGDNKGILSFPRDMEEEEEEDEEKKKKKRRKNVIGVTPFLSRLLPVGVLEAKKKWAGHLAIGLIQVRVKEAAFIWKTIVCEFLSGYKKNIYLCIYLSSYCFSALNKSNLHISDVLFNIFTDER